MGTLTLKRGGTSLRDHVRSPLGRALSQAVSACREFFDRVDTDRPRNMVRKISKNINLHLRAPHKFRVLRRIAIEREHGRIAIVRCVLKNKWERFAYYTYLNRSTKPEFIGYRLPRERMLTRIVGIALTATVVTTNADIGATKLDPNMELFATSVSTGKVTGPKNWLDGIPEANGFRKDALSGPLQYAKDSGYEFAATKERLQELVEDGALVELEETKSLTFNNVSRPYVLPVVAEFVYRLADQYNYGERCGPLVLNGAARDIAFQRTLGNGSKKSVHPTGMAVDFKSEGLEPRCAAWLEETLLEIEAARRIDYTKEVSEQSPHYHVTVATHEYERWLERRRTVDNADEEWLRKAMFYEGGPDESIEGYRAIGWVIRNRVRSADYPNTIEAVIAEGSAGKSDGGCQFSFMCDGKTEDRYTLCRTPSGELSSYLRFVCDMRWERATVAAKAVMTETNDPTGGAVLYHAIWMQPAPAWARPRTEKRADGSTVSYPYGDFANRPRKIGNHVFGPSLHRGKDIREGDAA